MERGGVFFLGPGKRITQLAPHSRELKEAEGRKGKEKTERVIFCSFAREKDCTLRIVATKLNNRLSIANRVRG